MHDTHPGRPTPGQPDPARILTRLARIQVTQTRLTAEADDILVQASNLGVSLRSLNRLVRRSTAARRITRRRAAALREVTP